MFPHAPVPRNFLTTTRRHMILRPCSPNPGLHNHALQPHNLHTLGVAYDEGPDALIFNNKQSLAIDVSVAYQSPASSSDVTVKRSDQKEKKYEALAKEMHWKILPLVFTGQCNPATKTIDAFKLIAAARPFAGLKRALLCSSVIACARGNADILGTARARFALVPSHVDSGQPPPHSSLRANTALSLMRVFPSPSRVLRLPPWLLLPLRVSLLHLSTKRMIKS
jgi:hypothetical protein